MRRLLVAVAAVIAAVALAGCTPDSEQVRSDDFPRRPVDVSVAQVQPCSMFSAPQQAELRLRKPSPTSPTVNGRPSVGCVWLTDSDLGYTAQTIPISADLAKTDPTATVIEVNGFGAVRNVVQELTGGAPTCQVTVDAAPGQSIRVQVQGATQPRRTDDEMCRLATDAASKVMTTVVATARP